MARRITCLCGSSMSYSTVQGRAVEGVPMREPRVDLGTRFGSSFYLFFLSGTSTPTNVYQDGALTVPFSPTGQVTSDAFGRFPAIYLDPSIIYRVRFFNSASVQQWQQDPYISQLSTVGTSALSAFGVNIATTGEFTIPAPNTGGSGVSLTLNASTLGTTPLRLNGTIPGTSALIVNSAATTGAQTATFAATNKPGTSTSAPAGWLPLTCDGVQYYTPIWHGNPFTPYTPAPTGAVIHIYTTPGSATESIVSAPNGTVQMEVWGGGGGGGGSSGSHPTFGGQPGGGGGLAYSLYAASALGGVGKTFNYTVPAGGAGGAFGSGATGSTGSTGSISAGTVTGFTTMTANGGVGGQDFTGSPGVGGTAAGGNNSNNTGGTGDTTGLSGHISGDGSPYGAGGISTSTGNNGAVVFYYT
jgi:hypothetical protein